MFAAEVKEGGHRRRRAPTFLCLDCRPNGQPPRSLQPAQPFDRRGPWADLRHLEPRYRLADQVPDREQAVAASHRLDAKLNGANPIDILIEFP